MRFLIFYDEFLTLFELMLISLYNLLNVNMKMFFDFVANMFRFFDKICLIFEIIFKTIIKFEICEKYDKRFFKLEQKNEIFIESISLNSFFVFRYSVFVLEYKNQTKNDENIIIFDKFFLTQIRKRDDKLSQIKNN